MNVLKLVSKAKVGMMLIPNTVFFSTLCSSLEIVITEQIDTAATDGFKIFINSNFFTSLTEQERIFLLAHETLHVAYMHISRIGKRDIRLWNDACDYVINLELHNRGFQFIKGGLLSSDYKGMNAEQIYKILEDNKNYISQSLPDLIKPTGTDNKELTESEIKSLEQKILGKITTAATIAEMSKQAGSIPDSVKRSLKDISKPKVNWKITLQRFFFELNKSNYSWSKPSRKYLPMYLPKLQQKDSLTRIDFAIDTSGSITESQFNQFISEVHSVLKTLNPNEIGVYQFDTKIQGLDFITNFRSLLKLTFKGGGGTDPKCVLDDFKNNSSKALIMLTDGYFRKTHLVNPNKPVIWVIYNNPNFIVSFGKVIHINFDENL